MAKRVSVLDRSSPAWCGVFGFTPEYEDCPAMEELRALGVREVVFQLGRTAEGNHFTNLTSIVAQGGQVVDVQWLVDVRLLCERMAPSLYVATMCAASSDGDDPESDCLELVAEGDLLVFVGIRVEQRIHALANVVFPASDVSNAPATE